MLNLSFKQLKTTQIEWPTWLLIVFVYAGWLMLVSFYHGAFYTPFLLVVVLAWHGSIQHELIHGHPTRNQKVNNFLAYPPLSLWYPYPIYRRSHVYHHNDERLTLPGIDPESFYVSQQQWNEMNAFQRKLATINMTLAGRLLLGPAVHLSQLVRQCYQAFSRGWSADSGIWLLHITLVAGLLLALNQLFEISAVQYFAMAYAAQSVTLLRSFFEHRAEVNPKHRSVIVQACWPMRLLFTNNNFHLIHHENPGLAWYRLSDLYKQDLEKYHHQNGDFVVAGYYRWWLDYLFNPVDNPIHPGTFSTDSTD